MKQSRLTTDFVDYIPEQLVEGVFYICERHCIAAHKCCCGCGEEVITPLTPADWSIRKEGDTVTLYPSVGNWSFACQSHYWIRRSEVVWATAFSPEEIKRVRARDREDKEEYIAAVNRWKAQQAEPKHDNLKPKNIGKRVFHRLWQMVIQ